jgi:hypothetical protein
LIKALDTNTSGLPASGTSHCGHDRQQLLAASTAAGGLSRLHPGKPPVLAPYAAYTASTTSDAPSVNLA